MQRELELLLNFDEAPQEIKDQVAAAKKAWLELAEIENQIGAWARSKADAEKAFNIAQRDLIRAMKDWDPSGAKKTQPKPKA